MKALLFFVAAFAAFVGTSPVSASEWDIGANSMQRQEALQQGRVIEAVVLQVRDVEVAPTTTATATSTGLGGLIGAALGAQAGKGNGKYVAGALGGILGGIAGNQIGQRVTAATAQEVILRKSDGSIIAVTQAESTLYAGQPVYLVESWGKVRVIPVQTRM